MFRAAAPVEVRACCIGGYIHAYFRDGGGAAGRASSEQTARACEGWVGCGRCGGATVPMHASLRAARCATGSAYLKHTPEEGFDEHGTCNSLGRWAAPASSRRASVFPISYIVMPAITKSSLLPPMSEVSNSSCVSRFRLTTRRLLVTRRLLRSYWNWTTSTPCSPTATAWWRNDASRNLLGVSHVSCCGGLGWSLDG